MGTSFTNPIGRVSRQLYHESSRLRSPRDSDVVQRAWRKNSTLELQVAKACQAIEQIQRELNRLRRRIGAADVSPSTPGTGMIFRGIWNIATDDYVSQNVVFRTPDGGSAGTYIGLLDNIPTGTAPETGAPWWAAFPYPPPGVWG
jgi:hypothetical protein